MRSILFICTANRCRSPMAEVLLQRAVEQRGEAAQWNISSAGTWAEADLGVTQLTRAVMTKRGLSVDEHRSRSLTAEMLHKADAVLVMTRNHKEAIQAEFPASVGRVFLLSQLVDQDYDIEDPYGGSLDDYELCASEIDDLLSRGFGRLVELTDRAVAP